MNTQLYLAARVIAFGAYFAALYGTLGALTGRWIPTNGEEDIWFVCAIAYVAYSLFDTPFFVPPSQVLASALPAAVLLLSLDLRTVGHLRNALEGLRWVGFSLAVVAAIAAGIAITLRGQRPGTARGTAYLERLAYRMATKLGRGAIMFTPPALISAVGYHQDEPTILMWIVVGWVTLVSMRPVETVLELIADVRGLQADQKDAQHVGEIDRVDSPNVVRVLLEPTNKWTRSNVHLCCLADGQQVAVLPLFTQTQGSAMVGTGLIHSGAVERLKNAKAGAVYSLRVGPDSRAILKALSGSDDADLIGFVVEESRIGSIQFEVASELELEAGKLVYCRQAGRNVYYQILDARTREESFQRNPRGTHVVTAPQLGVLDSANGFARYAWLPEMNSPVFIPKSGSALTTTDPPGTFTIGKIPRSEVRVWATFKQLSEYHTAILGVTGTGKTELAFDIIRQGFSEGTTIFCVDFTGEYGPRLSNLAPENLGFTVARMGELQDLRGDRNRAVQVRGREEEAGAMGKDRPP